MPLTSLCFQVELFVFSISSSEGGGGVVGGGGGEAKRKWHKL